MRHPHGLRAASGAAGGGPWDLGNPTYIGSFSVATEETIPQDLYISQTRLFIIGSSSDNIVQYAINNWDITSANYVRDRTVATYETVPTGLFFKSDGTRVYWTGTNSDRIYQSNLSTAWNISTPAAPSSLLVSGQDAQPNGIFFSSDGRNMFMVGAGGDNVYKYTMTAAQAWNVPNANYSQTFSVASEDNQPSGVHFKDDGKRMFVVGTSTNKIYQYELSTAWNLSTATLSKSYSIASQDIQGRGVFFKDDGTEMYMIGSATDYVYAYSL